MTPNTMFIFGCFCIFAKSKCVQFSNDPKMLKSFVSENYYEIWFKNNLG